MRFMTNYLDFFDIHGIDNYYLGQIKFDFMNGLREFLDTLTENKDETAFVSATVFNFMYKKNLHYHTPVHILSMFQLAEELKLELSNAEKLAIWFHDVIYYPNGKNNEAKSAELMKILLDNFVDNELLKSAGELINFTASHIEVTPDYSHKVMDLDLLTFGSKPEVYKKVTELIVKEFNFLDEETFLYGRESFLKALNAKGYIFRTKIFQENFEEQAQKNLSLS